MEHEERRIQIITIAQQLFFTKGYEHTTVAEIIDAAGIAKGSFFHYFASKDELLNGLINHIAGASFAELEAAITQSHLSPTEQLNVYFAGVTTWKIANREILIETMRVMYDDRNLQLRRRLTVSTNRLALPAITHIVRRGVECGEFRTQHPDRLAEFILDVFAVNGERWAALLLSKMDDRKLLELADEWLDFMNATLERLLGAETGTIHAADRAAMHELLRPLREETQ